MIYFSLNKDEEALKKEQATPSDKRRSTGQRAQRVPHILPKSVNEAGSDGQF